MSCRSKGNARQRQAQLELEKEGWFMAAKAPPAMKFMKQVDLAGGLFDFLFIKKVLKDVCGTPLWVQLRLWLQVKTRDAPKLAPFVEFKEQFCDENDTVAIWIWKKNKGWKKVYIEVNKAHRVVKPKEEEPDIHPDVYLR
jgi:hypothetical protein